MKAISIALSLSAVAVVLAWPQPAAQVEPIRSLWLADEGFLTPQTAPALAKAFRAWKADKVFDAFPIRMLPSTFEDPKQFVELANSLERELGGGLIVATFPVGEEGWETSHSEQFARQGGSTFEASRSVSSQHWLDMFQAVHAATWAWVLERPASLPTPEQAANSAIEFAHFARARHKKVVMWLSVMGLAPKTMPVVERVCAETRHIADYYVWIDLPGVVLTESLGHRPNSPEEARISPAYISIMEKYLDRIVALSPKEKVVMQWTHNPHLPTQNVDGTSAYIATCQKKGINRFCPFFSIERIGQSPWREFYHSLPKAN